MRVVSLVPSLTETVMAWGVDVVACTRFCEQPDLRHVGGTKDPDIAAIASLRPDLVLVDREENRLPDAESLAAAGLALHITHVTACDQVPAMLAALAAAVQVPPPAVDPQPVVARSPRLRAYVPIWKRPWMTIGPDTYGGSVLAALGVDVLVPEPDGSRVTGERYPEFDLDTAAARRPDVVLLPTEPYPFAERHVEQVRTVVPGVPVALVDGQDLFWWGVRTGPALHRLATALATICPTVTPTR